MEERGNPAGAATARLLQLRVASEKLENVLGQVVLLSEEVQDRVADTLQDLINSLRLLTLPTEVQTIILREAGRHTRSVSPFWRDTYGPLTCGLLLETTASHRTINALLATNPNRFRHVTSLVVTPPPPADPIANLPQSFPGLRFLHITAATDRLPAAYLLHLSPLSSCLTALHLPPVHALTPAATNLLLLTALRSLSLTSRMADDLAMARVTHELSKLPHLQQLQWSVLTGSRHPPSFSTVAVPAATWFPFLDGMHSLTALGLQMKLHDWDTGSLDTLGASMPRLSALTLFMTFRAGIHGSHTRNPHPPQGVMAALAQRTALTSLSLHLDHLPGHDHHLHALSSLRLASLEVLALDGSQGRLEALLEAMAVQRTLTSLSIRGDGINDSVCLSQAGLCSLACLAHVLVDLELGVCISARPDPPCCGLEPLTRLTRLALCHLAGCIGDLAGLTTLTRLRCFEVQQDAAGVIAEFCCECLPHMCNLRDVTLDGFAVDVDVAEAASRQPALTRLASAPSRRARLRPPSRCCTACRACATWICATCLFWGTPSCTCCCCRCRRGCRCCASRWPRGRRRSRGCTRPCRRLRTCRAACSGWFTASGGGEAGCGGSVGCRPGTRGEAGERKALVGGCAGGWRARCWGRL